MKVSKLSVLLLGGSLLFSAAAIAGPTNKKTIHLYEKVTVEGKQLAPGDYTFEWSDSDPNAVLRVTQGKETVATIPARIAPANKANAKDAYSLTTAGDGSKTFTEISFSGKKYNLEIGQASDASTAQSATSGSKN